MKSKKVIITRLVFAVILCLMICWKNIYSQQDNTIHLISVIPQAGYTNPAFQPALTYYIAVPVLSSFSLSLGHSGFAYRDLIKRRSDDSLEIRMDHLISTLAKRNYISFNLTEEFLAFGFRIKKNYFSVSVTDKASFHFAYLRDLVSLAWQGNGQYVGNKVDYTGIGINASYYREYALGFSREVKIHDHEFVFGGRVKYLNGLMDVYTKRNNATISIDENDFAHTVNTDFIVNTTLPDSVAIAVDSLGDKHYKMGSVDWKQLFLNQNNKGWGIDLGAYYKLNNKFSFGLSMLDFGQIRWRSGGGSSVRNYTCNVQDYSFEGIDISQFFKNSDSVVNSQINEVLDSLSNIFKVQKSRNSYTSPLPTKIYLTGIFSLTPKDRIGLLIRNDFFNKDIHPSVTLSYNKRFFNAISMTLDYSVMNRSFRNLGFGLAINLGSWQNYITTDNFYCLFDPESARNINVHFGTNFIFGYKEKKVIESMFRKSY